MHSQNHATAPVAFPILSLHLQRENSVAPETCLVLWSCPRSPSPPATQAEKSVQDDYESSKATKRLSPPQTPPHCWVGEGAITGQASAEVIVTWESSLCLHPGRATLMKTGRNPTPPEDLLFTKMDTSHRSTGRRGSVTQVPHLHTAQGQEGLTRPLNHQRQRKARAPSTVSKDF